MIGMVGDARFNAITIVPVRSLRPGDLIAYEFIGTVISGEVTGVVFSAAQLSPEQRKYMEEHGLDIPTEQYGPIAGEDSMLVFGDFHGYGLNSDTPGHAYLRLDMNVVSFPDTPMKRDQARCTCMVIDRYKNCMVIDRYKKNDPDCPVHGVRGKIQSKVNV